MMEPISVGLGIVGLGMQLFGGFGAANAQKQIAGLSAGVSQDEQRVNAQKQQQVQLQGRRMQLENLRNVQRARAKDTAAAVSGGAQFGTGLQGGLASASDQGTTNALGINQSLMASQNIFGINSDISGKRVQMANLGGTEATDQGIASLGGAVVKSGPILGAGYKDITQGSGGLFG
jgi:hypothetical protein